jgi:hypothetical protein
MTFIQATGAAGARRMREIADENRGQIETTAASLIRGLGREATELEVLEAEAIASLYVKARRLRSLGKDDIKVLRQAAILSRDSAFRHPLAAPSAATEPKD